MNRSKITLSLALAVFLIFCLVCRSFAAPADTEQEKRDHNPGLDSLFKVMDSTPVEDYLHLYYREWHPLLYQCNDIDTHLRYNSIFAESARITGQKWSEALSYCLRVEMMSNYKMPPDMIIAEAKRAMAFMNDVTQTEGLYFYTANIMVGAYILAGNFEDALAAAEGFYEEAKARENNTGIAGSLQSMGKAYEALELYDKAEASYREVLEMTDELIGPSIKFQAYHELIIVLNKLGRYEEALEVCRDFGALFDKLAALDDAHRLEDMRFPVDINYARTYTNLGRYSEAADHILRAEKYPPYATDHGKFILEEIRFYFLLEQGLYEDAERSLDRIDEVQTNALFHEKLQQKERRADLYHRWGLYGMAADSYKEYIVQNDSLQRVRMAERLNSLRTRYEVDRHIAEKERNRNYFLFAVGVCFLLFLLLAGATYYNRLVTRKNQNLYRQIKRHDRLEEELVNLREAYESLAASVSQEARSSVENTMELHGGPAQRQLVGRLREYLLQDRNLTKPDINRDDLIAALGTNKNTLSEAVKAVTDKTPMEYIRFMQLEEARRMLDDHPELKIEAIVYDCGFGTLNTFYRLFRKIYGISPAEYRKMSASPDN